MKEHISKIVDAWIAKDELPSRANLKPIKRFDDIYPQEGEAEAYWDFIKWAIKQEHLPLLCVKKRRLEEDFWET